MQKEDRENLVSKQKVSKSVDKILSLILRKVVIWIFIWISDKNMKMSMVERMKNDREK